MSTYTAEQIESIGGRRWTKNGKDRVYINADMWTKLIGLKANHYGTGNISGATLDGEPISNSRARDILGCIDKVWWDSVDGRIHITIYSNRYSDQVPGWIRQGIADAVAALKDDDRDNGTGSQADAAPADTPAAATTVAKLRDTGRTVRQIAAAIGVSISTVYRWARGICQPRPTNAAALAALA